MPRIVSVWLKAWPIARPLRAQVKKGSGSPVEAVDPRRPLVLVAPGKGGPHIVALNEAAQKSGLVVGELFSNARSKVLGLQACEADPIADGAALCAFIESHHWPASVALGWSLEELFGINWHAPLARIDSQGLVTWLALSTLKGIHLETFGQGCATIRCRSGSLLMWRRGSAGLDAAVQWWNCPAMIRTQETALPGGVI